MESQSLVGLSGFSGEK